MTYVSSVADPIVNDVDHAVRAVEGGDWPAATAHLRVAVRHAPNQPLLREGLNLARAQVMYPADAATAALIRPPDEIWPGMMFGTPVVIGSFMAFSLLCVALTLAWATRRKRWLWVAAICLPFGAVPAINAVVRWSRAEHDAAKPPVVISMDTPLREGNGPAYPVRATLPRGVECRRLGERGDWMQVEFASGLVGWVPAATVIPVPD